MFRLRVAPVCKLRVCKEYAVVATPANENTGNRNFCSRSEGVIRYKVDSPAVGPVSVAESREWMPMQKRSEEFRDTVGESSKDAHGDRGPRGI